MLTAGLVLHVLQDFLGGGEAGRGDTGCRDTSLSLGVPFTCEMTTQVQMPGRVTPGHLPGSPFLKGVVRTDPRPAPSKVGRPPK